MRIFLDALQSGQEVPVPPSRYSFSVDVQVRRDFAIFQAIRRLQDDR
jgi:hypothetical protein